MQKLPLTCLECDVEALGIFWLCEWEKVKDEQGAEGSCAGHSPGDFPGLRSFILLWDQGLFPFPTLSQVTKLFPSKP